MRKLGSITSLLLLIGPSVSFGDALDDNQVASVLWTLPCVKRVEVTGPSRPVQTIVHLRQWHFLPRAVFDADVRSVSRKPVTDPELDKLYEEFLLEVERVGVEQTAILRCLIRDHGLRQVFVEGLTGRDKPIFVAKIAALRKLETELPGYKNDLAAARQRLKDRQIGSDESARNRAIVSEIESLLYQHRLDLLRVGSPGQLVLSDELAELLPLEDETAYMAANPVGKNGELTLDSEKNERREDAHVRNLLGGGPLVVVVLGGSHDLSDNITRLGDGKCRYVSVTTKGFEEASETGK